jgi:hypothetical protein
MAATPPLFSAFSDKEGGIKSLPPWQDEGTPFSGVLRNDLNRKERMVLKNVVYSH